jgi:hypothetical protein
MVTNAVFHNEKFWRLYFTLEADYLPRAEVQLQLDGLQQDFRVRTDTIDFTYQGEHLTAQKLVVEFPFPLTERASLLIDYNPDTHDCDINLFLIDRASGTNHQMGWWDLARWHPYCLRTEELELLLATWRAAQSPWPAPDVALLLLSPFVGVCDDASWASLLGRVQASFASLCPTALQPLPAECFQVQSDSEWKMDAELGWVLKNAEYDCYSIRNRSHACGDGSGFPFALWNEAVATIGERQK